MLAEQGYDRMSVDAVATDAEVARATIYRRWPTKADLVGAALCCLSDASLAPSPEDTRRYLVDSLTGMRDHMERFGCLAIVGSLLAQRREHPEMLDTFRAQVITPARARMRLALEAGVASGQVRRDVDLDIAGAMLVGAYFAEAISGGDTAGDWPERVVAQLWPTIAAER
jgi:AcrR family transcriptional regulator